MQRSALASDSPERRLIAESGARKSHLQAVLTHEWLVSWGGSESVLQSLMQILPNADIHTLVFQPDSRTAEVFPNSRVVPSLLDRVPLISSLYPYALPIMPYLWRRKYIGHPDLVVSSSHAFSKGARAPRAFHVCYCHTPPRYLWDLSSHYLPGWASRLTGPLRARLRDADLKSAENVDHFVANSNFVADRIRRFYGRTADVLHPPVDTDLFTPSPRKRTHFLAGGRLVAYKRIDLAIRAAESVGLPLIVFGEGPERRRLETLAGPGVRFVGAVGHSQLLELIRSSWAFLYPGVEDFGILPVEVQAAGTPVLARAIGGVLDTVEHEVTGLLYESAAEDEATQVRLLGQAMQDTTSRTWEPASFRAHAEQFSRANFEQRFIGLLRKLGFEKLVPDYSDCP